MASFRRSSGFGGAAFAVASVALPIAVPHLDPTIGYVLAAIAGVLLPIFLTLLFVDRSSNSPSGTVMHNPVFNIYGDQRDALGIPGGGPLPPLTVTPAPIIGNVGVAEEQDTSQTPGTALPHQNQIYPPTVGVIRNLYVGQIILSAAQLTENLTLEIAIRAFNGSTETLRMIGVEGIILAGVENANGAPLPRATWRPEHSAEPIPPGSEFTVVLNQPLSQNQVDEYLAALENAYVALDLRQLNVLVQSEDAPALRERLPLWDGVTIRRRADLFTGRITMATLTGMSLSVSMGGVSA